MRCFQVLAAGVVSWPTDINRPTMTGRRIWKQHKTGNIANLHLRKDRIPQPGEGEARIAIKSVGLNFADVFTTLGLYAAAPKTEVIPGLEFAGVVEELGPQSLEAAGRVLDVNSSDQTETSGLLVGDRVMGVTRFGAFADTINADASLLQRIPASWTFQAGAAFLVQGLTAMYGLRSQGNLRCRQTVLVHSAAGGCGQFAMAICNAFGATPIATVGATSKVDYLLKRFPWLRREQVIVRDASRFESQLEAALAAEGAKGFDIVLDAVSGEFFMPGFNALAPGGRYVIYGAANWTPTGDKPGWLKLAAQYLRRPRLDPLQMIGQNRSLMGFNLIYLFEEAPALREIADELLGLGLPAPQVAAEFDFEDAPAAVRYLQSGQATGKVVLTVND